MCTTHIVSLSLAREPGEKTLNFVKQCICKQIVKNIINTKKGTNKKQQWLWAGFEQTNQSAQHKRLFFFSTHFTTTAMLLSKAVS